MEVTRRFLNDAALLTVPSFGDDRGSFTVAYEAEAAAAAGLPDRFVQDNHSISRSVGTLRGIHLQLPPHEQGKLVRVLKGRIVDLVVDLRPGSSTCGRSELIELGAGDNQVLWVPPGFGHGFCTLEPDTEVFYKVDARYRPDAERTLAWDDPTLAIDWPVERERVVLSAKDMVGLPLAEIMELIQEAGR